MKWRLLRGRHSHGFTDKPGREAHNKKPGVIPQLVQKIYVRGDVFEEDTDLNKLFPSIPPKFQQLPDSWVDPMDALTSLQFLALKKKAKEEQIDVEGMTTKDEILAAFKSVLSPV